MVDGIVLLLRYYCGSVMNRTLLICTEQPFFDESNVYEGLRILTRVGGFRGRVREDGIG